ncbi:hypothetical protein [Roseateles amylovorans]|uniref:Uncharacterized protein n=1 Tax=Roseateles amylovorans TaxID=2978473 RepID=A0ABY6B590_9BURK|nr:hypothetical protein [Roseateles amylovorans]UXH80551.1 hypothetical protein N4261_12035 [Roseateles amylovorans]
MAHQTLAVLTAYYLSQAAHCVDTVRGHAADQLREDIATLRQGLVDGSPQEGSPLHHSARWLLQRARFDPDCHPDMWRRYSALQAEIAQAGQRFQRTDAP